MDLKLTDDRPANVTAKATITMALVIGVNLAAWSWAWLDFSARPTLLGTAFLAYMLGLRHAFDADHIAAIDNVVRKLMREGKTPLSTGLFFSLGHSTVVILACVAIAAAVTGMHDQLDELHAAGSVVGTSVSALFLLTIGAANLMVLRGAWSVFLQVRRGEPVLADELDALLADRGLIARMLKPIFGLVSRSWHMYPVGFLFGLGFDTATEIGLLGISAVQVANGMAFGTILVFPTLFAAGMSLMDTADSILMAGAYGWAFSNPLRKLWYNLTVTAASIFVALFIGGIEALGLVGEKLNLHGGFFDAVNQLDEHLTHLGYVVAGIFVLSWAVSAVVFRIGGYDRVQGELS